MNKIEAWFDGAAVNNGQGGYIGMGAYIHLDGKLFMEYDDILPPSPNNSSNMAEYLALKWILDTLHSKNYTSADITIHGDSKLVIEQMSGNWKVKSGLYKSSALHCLMMKTKFSSVKFVWIPRHLNKKADELSSRKLIALNLY